MDENSESSILSESEDNHEASSDTEKNKAISIAKPIERRKRTQRPYPMISFEEALQLAQFIQEVAAGQKVRRLILLDHLGKSESSSTTRNWITGASKYGIITGSYRSEYLELTEDGYKASADNIPLREQNEARIQLAISNIEPFKVLYNKYVGDKLPLKQVLRDSLQEQKIENKLADELADLFLLNLKFVGLLQTVAGAERILTIEHLLEELPKPGPAKITASPDTKIDSAHNVPLESSTFDKICFYITPIGEPDTEIRQHSDLFLEHLVKPALSKHNLEVIRADQIDKPGTITRQIIDYILRSRLVIADLSFHNPNVFYELALRHAARLPTVQIIRTGEIIPFDVNQNRTIRIDCSSIYVLIPRLETYRAEIANQVRRALEDPDSVDNPITTFYPTFKVSLG